MDDVQPGWIPGYHGLGLVLAYLALGLWASATGGAWLLGMRAVLAGLWGRRRLVNVLRWSTKSGSINFCGLVVMVLIANPGRWRTAAWFISLLPLGLSVLAVAIARGRGEEPIEPTADEA